MVSRQVAGVQNDKIALSGQVDKICQISLRTQTCICVWRTPPRHGDTWPGQTFRQYWVGSTAVTPVSIHTWFVTDNQITSRRATWDVLYYGIDPRVSSSLMGSNWSLKVYITGHLRTTWTLHWKIQCIKFIGEVKY